MEFNSKFPKLWRIVLKNHDARKGPRPISRLCGINMAKNGSGHSLFGHKYDKFATPAKLKKGAIIQSPF